MKSGSQTWCAFIDGKNYLNDGAKQNNGLEI